MRIPGMSVDDFMDEGFDKAMEEISDEDDQGEVILQTLPDWLICGNTGKPRRS